RFQPRTLVPFATLRLPTCIVLILLAISGIPRRAVGQNDPGVLTLQRLMQGEFQAQTYGPIRWVSDSAYTVLEPSSSTKNGEDLVRYDAASGRKAVLVPASRLIPPGDSVPIDVEDFAWAPSGPRLLVYTNAQRVWRQKTRG